MNRCPVCNDLMSRDQISDTVILLQCPTCEHEEYEPADTSDLDTQPVIVVTGEPTFSVPDDLTIKVGIPADDNGEDTIILRHELDEGR